MSICIAAIPRVDDPLWDISSEKIPHLTLLFLGDIDEGLEQVIEYVQHVCQTSLKPFGLSVESRGELGPDRADVYFLDKNKRALETPQKARTHFLQNEAIARAYASVDQYPEWTPHVTLGYPATPANPVEEKNRYHQWVEFDRIAVWVDDFEGPTFKLQSLETETEPGWGGGVGMAEKTAEFLEHHGVKGMKWGVRNDKGHEGERATNKKIAKLDKKYETADMGKYFKVYNAMASRMNDGGIAKFNSDFDAKYPKYKRKDMTDPSTPHGKLYTEAYSKLATKVLNEESAKHLGQNASGTKEWRWKYDVAHQSLPTAEIVDTKRVKHEDDSIPVNVIWDESGLIKKIDFGGSLKQEDVSGFLAHYGVKGQRWGVIRDRLKKLTDDGVPDGKVTVNQDGTKITAKGGKNFRISEDAAKTAASKQVAKRSGTAALSTKELQELVNRMNLEQQYAKLSVNTRSPGQKFINDTVSKIAKEQAAGFISREVNGYVKRKTGS